ncbi:MAG: Gldg family protein [Odoribacteraceae bacterium]|jgi:ABC-2 type transport system permease protein|nr:Gldg family protein [Odoribacteraceae bacterium]
MKKIRKIALVELQTFFYSPVAWLILIVFAFQAAMIFTDIFATSVRNQELKYPLSNLTLSITRGTFAKIQEYLYFYIPLLTMSLMSRELGSGSIKLLYSSPVTNAQIILGKYLAMLAYGLVMMGVVAIIVTWSAFTVKDFDLPVALSGMMGLYLLLAAYAAIGLFMSSLTSYQVVAAMGTLAVLAALSLVKRVGQEYDFIREITWWLSIGGRADEFILGLICSEDLLYFVIVPALFLALSISRLKATRQKTRWHLSLARYAGIFLVAILAGYVTSRPSLMAFHDATRTKQLTLTPPSQQIISQLEGPLKMTVYVNALDRNLSAALPRARKSDMERFSRYTRFKPEMQVKYVYYYANPGDQGLERRYPGMTERRMVGQVCQAWDADSTIFKPLADIENGVDLAPEGYRLVRLLERETGEKTFLRMFDDMTRYPSEAEISAALKRLVIKPPLVAFVTGHGERDINDAGDRGYYRFSANKHARTSLVNQGFDCVAIDLGAEVPGDVDALVIADPRRPFAVEERERLARYIARGGDLLLLGDLRGQEVLNPLVAPLGLAFLPGQIVRYPVEAEKLPATNVASLSSGRGAAPARQNIAPDFFRASLDRGAAGLSRLHESLCNITRSPAARVAMPGCLAIERDDTGDYNVIPLFLTDPADTWNELQTTNFIDDTARLDVALGETRRSHATAVALTRTVGERRQKIIVLGDADCLSNERVNGVNSNFVMATFLWFSDDALPVDVRRPATPDDAIFATGAGVKITKNILMFAFPSLLLLASLLLWLRRRGR